MSIFVKQTLAVELPKENVADFGEDTDLLVILIPLTPPDEDISF